MNPEVLCSDQRVEPLPGTAKTGTLFIALEHALGWSHDIMDGGVFGPDLTAELADYLKTYGASLQLIRKPGREGQQRDRRVVFIADVRAGTARKHVIDHPRELLDINPLDGSGEPVEHPVILVCTHGKRDRCCALKSRPLAAHLEEQFPGDMVWESSHTKGHRFAPSIIALPWGYSFGRLNELAATDMVRFFAQGQLFLAGNRGRSCYSRPEQVAELAVANTLAEAGERVELGSLRISGGEVMHIDGRRWQVDIEEREVDGVISSCGDAPKRGKAVVAVGVRELDATR